MITLAYILYSELCIGTKNIQQNETRSLGFPVTLHIKTL